MNDNLYIENAIAPAWNMAIWSITITKALIFHSERESLYVSYKSTNIIKNYGLRSEAELSVLQWIETWFNRVRRIHSTLKYKIMEEFETELYKKLLHDFYQIVRFFVANPLNAEDYNKAWTFEPKLQLFNRIKNNLRIIIVIFVSFLLISNDGQRICV